MLVPFFTTREAAALLANDPIVLATFIWSFGHLEDEKFVFKWLR